MKPHHIVRNVSVLHGKLMLEVDGRTHSFDLREVSNRLASANEDELSTFEVSPAGYGIHWPMLDEDISIDALLGRQHSPDSEQRRA